MAVKSGRSAPGGNPSAIVENIQRVVGHHGRQRNTVIQLGEQGVLPGHHVNRMHFAPAAGDPQLVVRQNGTGPEDRAFTVLGITENGLDLALKIM